MNMLMNVRVFIPSNLAKLQSQQVYLKNQVNVLYAVSISKYKCCTD